METEIKYRVQGSLEEFANRLRAVYPEVQYTGHEYLPAIYYDTRESDLLQAKSALRIRKERGVLIGCFKTVTAKDHVFIEEELELTPEDVHLTWYERLANYSRILECTGNAPIQQILQIETDRTTFLLKQVLSDEVFMVEIALDQVNYLAGKAYEERVEVELKVGNLDDFGCFLHKFEQTIGGLAEIRQSKYDRANEILKDSV